MFSLEEKIILIQAVQEKSWMPEWQREFDDIVEKYLEDCHCELYRGITQYDNNKLSWISKGSIFSFEQPTSFSSDPSIAHEFCGAWAQETFTVIKLKIDEAFPLCWHIEDILFNACEELQNALLEGSNRTWENYITSVLFDVSREREWIIPASTQIKVEAVDKESNEAWVYDSVVYNAGLI